MAPLRVALSAFALWRAPGDDGHITFDEGDLTRADFTEASLTTTGDDSDIDFRDADLTDAEFLGAYVDASGTLYNDPTTA